MAGISKAFFRAEPGQLVQFEGRQFKITHLLSVESVLAVDMETNESKRLHIDSVKPHDSSTVGSAAPCVEDLDLSLYSKEDWAEGQRRFQAIKPLLQNPWRTRADAERVAKEFGLHTATLYKWLKQYQQAGHVSALVPAKRGRKAGTRLLNDKTEEVINSAIEDLYLNKQRHTPQYIIEEVLIRCRRAHIAPPHPNTVRNRLAVLRPAEVLRRRGRNDAARDKYQPIRGEFPGADYPFAVVQIDHTLADIILVDEVHRKAIGRPWLTLAIDVHSRMIAGLYLSFENPSATSIGMCLSLSMCPKREYLAELGISGDWSVWGVMANVHSDNGKDFHSVVLDRASQEYHFELRWRPVKDPHFGGHIERLMGVVAGETEKLPGATFNNPKKRKGYDSEKFSALTLREYEQHLVDFIVNVYHQRVHSAIGMSPRKKWEIGVLGDATSTGTGIMPMPEDPLRVRLDFMPFFERSVQRYGIQIDNIFYYDHVLDAHINEVDPDNSSEKRVFVVRRDPRDISKVYFFDPIDKRYLVIPYRNIGLPAMSAWELREVQALLKAEGKSDVNEGAIFNALERMRERVSKAIEKTKSARRQATRNPESRVSHKPAAPRVPVTAAPGSASIGDAEIDPFAQSIVPFDEISLKR